MAEDLDSLSGSQSKVRPTRGPAIRARRQMEEWSVEVMDVAQGALLMAGWVVAFMLGRELQTGFSEWQQARRQK